MTKPSLSLSLATVRFAYGPPACLSPFALRRGWAKSCVYGTPDSESLEETEAPLFQRWESSFGRLPSYRSMTAASLGILFWPKYSPSGDLLPKSAGG